MAHLVYGGMMISNRVKVLEYSIRELIPYARELEKKGSKVLYLNIGDPLKYDFDTPRHIKEALYRAVINGHNYYGDSKGDPELRDAIAEKEKEVNGVKIEPSDIIVTMGVSEAINIVFASLVSPGVKVLIPSPTYPLYKNFTLFYGGEPLYYPLLEEEKWRADLESIRRGLEQGAKLVVLINPHNPTGSIMPEKDVREILSLAGEYGAIVISDEIYDRIVYDCCFKSTASITSDTTVIGLNGFSKVYLMTGWRLGYIYVKTEKGEEREMLINAFTRLAMNRLSASTPIQKAAIAALKGDHSYLNTMLSRLRSRRDILIKILEESNLIDIKTPQAAFYAFPKINLPIDDKELAFRLLKEEKVLTVPGSGFAAPDNHHLRLVFLPPEHLLEEAANRIVRFVERIGS